MCRCVMQFETRTFLSDPAKVLPKSEQVHLEKLQELLALVPAERSTTAAKEEWVHTAEQLVSILPLALPTDHNFDVIVEKVISLVETGLDYEEALNQPQPGYKLRHIKVGVRLVEAMCNCGETITEKLMNKINVHKKLIDLYHQEYMALSIKLMILKALDSSLRYKKAVDYFLNSDGWNGYKRLVEMVQAKQLARVQFAITSILQKLHLREILETLNKSVSKLPFADKKEDNGNSELDIENISNSLEEILRFYINAPTLMTHPKRFLPVSAQFEIGSSSSLPDPYPAIYTYFRTHKLLETFHILLTQPSTSCYSSIVIPIHELITCLQETHNSLMFLAAVPESINPLLRVLLGSSASNDEAEEPNNQLGLHLVYRLQALHHIDHLLRCYHKQKRDSDNHEVFEHLQGLFCLTFSVIGKMAVVHVLSQGEHIGVLLKLYKEKSIKEDAKIKKSPGKSFLADLISLTVKFTDNIPFFQNYTKELLDFIPTETGQELNDLLPWLKPVENPSAFLYDDVSGLLEVIKTNAENVTSLPGELITAVRVLKYLGIPQHEREYLTSTSSSFEYIELKYKCVIIQLFSLEAITHLSTALQKLCENYEQPVLHSARLVGRHGLALMAFVRPAIQLIRRILTEVIRCRNTEFKDLTTISILLQTYSLMQAIPATAHAHLEAQKVCRDIVETLLAYTQPSSHTESLNKSLWTLMMTEVLKYAVSTPNTFLPGLSLLSELLPLPLQVQTRQPLSEGEVKRLVNSRKLWSAHLHSLSSLVHDVISTMCTSGYSPLLQLLRSVCVQLADLAAPTALAVTRAVLDSILKAAVPIDRPVTGYAVHLLTFLACITTYSSVKAALIHLTTKQSATDKGSQRYADLIFSLSHILRTSYDCPTHVQAQECIVSLVQSLCHCELTLVPPPSMLNPTTQQVYLANTLPPRDLLATFIMAMLEHVSDKRSSLATLQPTLRTFLMLTEHDYGFFHLKNCLDKKTDALWSVLAKVAFLWISEKSDCLATLNTLLEVLRGCLTPDAPDEVLGLPARSITITAPELANMLVWDRKNDDNKHPLYTINKLLQESRTEDETLETLCENVTELIRLLEEEGSKPLEIKEAVEPLLPAPDSLLTQFSARPVFVVAEGEDERLSASYWLSVPPPDDQDSDIQLVTCDLIEVANAEIPNEQLVEKVAALCRHKAAPGDLEASPSTKKRATNMAAEDNSKRPFIAPMRGRGFRGSSAQRGDVFRSRPPNTSRPPSLHVDDFVALETCGQQPTGPTGYNKQSMRAAQDMIATRAAVNRGRPRPFGMDRGGRFFPVPYARRDNGGGRDGPGPHWMGEGAGPGIGGFRPLPPPDMRGLPHFPGSRPPLRVPPPTHPWHAKENREGFIAPPMRGGPSHRSEPNRHMRFFSR